MNDLSDALSAASLLLAAIALVYSAWSTSIDAAIDMPLGTTDDDTAEIRKIIRDVCRNRAIPIAAACWLLLAVFSYRDFRILAATWRCIGTATCQFNDIGTIFLFSQVIVLGMALHATQQMKRLRARL